MDSYPDVMVDCARCGRRHVAWAFDGGDETEWIVDAGPCRAVLVAPVSSIAAFDPHILCGVRARLERALVQDACAA